MIAAALRCVGRLRDTFLLELGRARAEREADQFLKAQGARVLAEREAAEEVSEPAERPLIPCSCGCGAMEYGPSTSATPRAEDGPASTTPPVGVGHPTSVVQETAAGAPGGGVVGDPSPAAGQPNLLGLASVDDLRMAAIGLDAKFDHRDWAALADRLRNLADFWNPAVTST